MARVSRPVAETAFVAEQAASLLLPVPAVTAASRTSRWWDTATLPAHFRCKLFSQAYVAEILLLTTANARKPVVHGHMTTPQTNSAFLQGVRASPALDIWTPAT